MNHIFSEILGFETHKSKEEKFRILFSKHNLKIDECIFVTDTLGDIFEASKVGLRTIAVDFGFHDKGRLKKGKPLMILSKFEDILPAIEKL
ncbi:HAD family hydrolase [Candidatus Pacearchaeota archaeon]|nr:HAD family hydrolase [Candidatus Pacearchaeota archaeon]